MFSALTCMAVAIYFEARSEPIAGQFAIANVIMNRVFDDRYPNDICDVVKQGKLNSKPTDRVYINQCQFSFFVMENLISQKTSMLLKMHCIYLACLSMMLGMI
mgnify:CR=1 FL=1